MEVGSEEYKDYLRMTTAPETGMRIIGSGEAAGIAMAKQRNGTLASNNLRDIRPYVVKYAIAHITTGDILIEAMEAYGNVACFRLRHFQSTWRITVSRKNKRNDRQLNIRIV